MKKTIKKGKITMTITIGIACLVLVMVMSMQFKIVNETDITSIENMRETELRTELANWKSKYEETDKQLEETQAKLEEYKKTKQSNEQTEELLENEIKQVNIALGKTNLEGQGIEIIIRETNNEEISKVTADDLIVIVNSLKLSGAEAISINDERIINMTDIGGYLVSFYKNKYPNILIDYYKVQKHNNINDIFVEFANKYKLFDDDTPDYERISQKLYNDLVSGKIVGVTFDEYC